MVRSRHQRQNWAVPGLCMYHDALQKSQPLAVGGSCSAGTQRGPAPCTSFITACSRPRKTIGRNAHLPDKTGNLSLTRPRPSHVPSSHPNFSIATSGPEAAMGAGGADQPVHLRTPWNMGHGRPSSFSRQIGPPPVGQSNVSFRSGRLHGC